MSMCGTCGEFINEGRCQCPKGLESLAGTIRIGWYIPSDPGATFDASELVTKLETVLDRLENAIVGALSQTVDVYIDGKSEPPVRVCFDIGGHDIEIDDGPVNGSLREIRGVE